MALFYWFSERQSAAADELTGHGWPAPGGMVQGRAYTEISSKPTPEGAWDDYVLVAVEETATNIG
jgi:hypothetical protein